MLLTDPANNPRVDIIDEGSRHWAYAVDGVVVAEVRGNVIEWTCRTAEGLATHLTSEAANADAEDTVMDALGAEA